MLQFPAQLEHIPDSYLQKNNEAAGQLISLAYDTYESFTYEQHRQKLHKRAIVYLPPYYTDKKQYNVFYLMHGGWSDETTYLGTPDDPHPFKYVLDNAILHHQMVPMIVVCPTYNNLHDHDSDDYGLALRLTNNYHHELINDLLPAVEGRLRTYADNVTKDGLAASRDHRAFCGFSMGSVTTWHVFQYCLRYFRYFFPSSGVLTDNARLLASFVAKQGFGPDDFFIFAASGTADFAYRGFTAQIEAMRGDQDTFRFAPDEEHGNLYYLVAPGGVHGPENAHEDFYNALIQLWKEK